MTIDEAIKHAEEVAEEKENEGKLLCQSEGASIGCLTCAEEHRQLAEWLRDYKRLKEQEPCEDAISRKAVVKYIKASDADLGHDSENEFAVEDILNMPHVTPVACIAKVTFAKDELQKIVDEKVKELAQHMESRWIPCSERLPEIDEDGYSSYVLVSFSNFTLPCIGQLRKTDGENHWYEGDDEKALDSFGLHVNAWMPLPNPYKAESEEQAN